MPIQFNPTFTNDKSVKSKKKRNLSKSICAHVLGGAGLYTCQMLMYPLFDLHSKVDGKRISNEDKVQLKGVANKMLEVSGLKKKGVSVVYHPTEKIPISWKEYIRPHDINDLKRGTQAFFTQMGGDFPLEKISFPTNSVNLPEEGLYTVFAHEIGHAMNAFGSNFTRFINNYKLRAYPQRIAMISIFLSAFTSKRKAEDGQELSKKDKIHNTVRDNAYLFPMLAAIPMLIQEASATLRGERLAKKWIPKEFKTRMFLANRIAFSTYLLHTGACGLGVFYASRFKDSMVERAERKSLKNKGVV